jgi:hypothetical protein
VTRSERPPLSTWFQIGIGVGALGFIVAIGTFYYWMLLFGVGDAAGRLWGWGSVLIGGPLLLGLVGIVALVRRARVGFWLIALELAVLFATGIGANTLINATLMQQILLAVGFVLVIVGFFRTRPTAEG